MDYVDRKVLPVSKIDSSLIANVIDWESIRPNRNYLALVTVSARRQMGADAPLAPWYLRCETPVTYARRGGVNS